MAFAKLAAINAGISIVFLVWCWFSEGLWGGFYFTFLHLKFTARKVEEEIAATEAKRADEAKQMETTVNKPAPKMAADPKLSKNWSEENSGVILWICV